MSSQTETILPSVKRRVSRRGPLTRAALIDTAIQLVAENGIEKTSVVEITQKLNISNGSFYYHFANIDELLQVVGTTVVDTFLDEISPSSEMIPPPGSPAACSSGTIRLTETLSSNPLCCASLRTV